MNTMVLTRQGLIYRAWSVDCEEGKLTYTCVKLDEPLPIDVESALFITVSSDEVICTYQDNMMSRTVVDVMYRTADIVSKAPVWTDYVHENGSRLTDKYREDCIRYVESLLILKRNAEVHEVFKLIKLMRLHHGHLITVPDDIDTEDKFYNWVLQMSDTFCKKEGLVRPTFDPADD